MDLQDRINLTLGQWLIKLDDLNKVLSASEVKVFLHIIRRTNGGKNLFREKLKNTMNHCQMSRQTVTNSLNNLAARNIIKQVGRSSHYCDYQIVNEDEWLTGQIKAKTKTVKDSEFDFMKSNFWISAEVYFLDLRDLKFRYQKSKIYTSFLIYSLSNTIEVILSKNIRARENFLTGKQYRELLELSEDFKKIAEASKNHASIDAKKNVVAEKLDSNSHSQAHIELESSPQPQEFPSLAKNSKQNDTSQQVNSNAVKSINCGVRVKITHRANEDDNHTTNDRYNSSKKMEERFNQRSHYQPNKPEWEQYASEFMSNTEIEGFQEWFSRTRLAGKGCYRERQPDRLEIRRAISARFSSINNPDDKIYIQECMTAYMREKEAIERRSELADCP